MDIFTNVGTIRVVIIKMKQGIRHSFNYEMIITPLWYTSTFTNLHFQKKNCHQRSLTSFSY